MRTFLNYLWSKYFKALSYVSMCFRNQHFFMLRTKNVCKLLLQYHCCLTVPRCALLLGTFRHYEATFFVVCFTTTVALPCLVVPVAGTYRHFEAT